MNDTGNVIMLVVMLSIQSRRELTAGGAVFDWYSRQFFGRAGCVDQPRRNQLPVIVNGIIATCDYETRIIWPEYSVLLVLSCVYLGHAGGMAR